MISLSFFKLDFDLYQVMGDGEEHGVVKIADFGLARIYQAPLKPLYENGVKIAFVTCKKIQL